MYKPYCTDSALGGRMWAKRALLGGFWPIRTVRACFGGEDARMTPKCGTSMDRAHRDLSTPARRLCAGKGKGQRARAGPDLGPGPSSSRAPSSSPARPPARTNARARAHTPIRVALNGAIAHVMNGRKSESRIERSSASESDCRDPPIAALANPALIPRGRSLSDPKRVAAVPWDVLRPDRLPVPRR